jgi:ABC-2 type transport system ATP-binding protein/ribosome-dependent ATPase
MSTTLAEARRVVRRYGDFVAVDRVDLRVEPGEVVGLLGANGAGKTTLIRMLLGLERVSEGNVALFGGPPSRDTRRRLGYVPQGLGLYDDLTAAENLAFARAAYGSATERPGDPPPPVDELPEGVVGRLPLGIQRRVAFGQALAHRPDLLVLDEPTSGVDPLARARLWDTIHDVAEGGAGVLVTTHFMEEAEQCGRLVVMAGGRVVAEGTAAEIIGTSAVAVVETAAWAAAFDALDRAGIAAVLVGRALRVPAWPEDQVARALAAAGVAADVHSSPATLEERFFEIIRASAP